MTRLIGGGYAEAGARGLYPLDLGLDALTVGKPLASVVNVSGGVRVPGTGCWFLADERAGEIVLVDADAGWSTLARAASGGDGPCHLALDGASRRLAVANYDSGHVALFRLDADSRPTETPSTWRAERHGPDADRQRGPHAHWVGFAPDGRLYAVDLGADCIFEFAANAEVQVAYAATPGTGPRQLAFHPRRPVAYLVSELVSALTVLDIGAEGQMTARQTLSLLPAPVADNLGGAIAIDEKGSRLYISNRGHDSIATFALDDDGNATLTGHVSSNGRSPRFLLIHEGQLLVAHEQAGGVTAFTIDPEGNHYLVGRANVPGAAFLGVAE